MIHWVRRGGPIEARLRSGRPVLVRARGGSMQPFITDGVCLWVEPRRGAVRPGEVVVRRTAGGLLICHRVQRVFRRWLRCWVVTTDDSTGSLDPPAPLHQVLGRVVAVRRAGRWSEVDRGDPWYSNNQ